MKDYKGLEGDVLKKALTGLHRHWELDQREVSKLLDELQELLEANPENGKNLCLSGEMPTLLSVMMENQHCEMRRRACLIFSEIA